MVFLKVRLVPSKELMIPRQELLGALISIRCMDFVSSKLQLLIFKNIYGSTHNVSLAG